MFRNRERPRIYRTCGSRICCKILLDVFRLFRGRIGLSVGRPLHQQIKPSAPQRILLYNVQWFCWLCVTFFTTTFCVIGFGTSLEINFLLHTRVRLFPKWGEEGCSGSTSTTILIAARITCLCGQISKETHLATAFHLGRLSSGSEYWEVCRKVWLAFLFCRK